jgi:hypothetical protein
MKLEHLITLVVGGVILADLVSHVAGTKALFNGFNILWDIGTEPTDTKLLSTAMSNEKGK